MITEVRYQQFYCVVVECALCNRVCSRESTSVIHMLVTFVFLAFAPAITFRFFFGAVIFLFELSTDVDASSLARAPPVFMGCRGLGLPDFLAKTDLLAAC